MSNTRLKLAEYQAKAKHHPGAELLLLKIISFVHPDYHAEIIGDIF